MELPRVGSPDGLVGWGALALGAAVLAQGSRAMKAASRRERWIVLALAACAALLSLGYVQSYLRGGPRIIDATSYWLEARGLSRGLVTWPAGDPETSALGRFLVRSEGEAGARAGVLFPPGYPLLLALGFLAGAPMLVGPLLAAAIVVATHALAREAVISAQGEAVISAQGEAVISAQGEPNGTGSIDAHPSSPAPLEQVPIAAAALSVVCGTLRYHTADTMSHGLAALLFTLAITWASRARRPSFSFEGGGSRPRNAPGQLARAVGVWPILAGLASGWLFATRPASGLACALAVAWLLAARSLTSAAPPAARADTAASARADTAASARRTTIRRLAAAAAGALPFAIMFLLHQRLVTGRWLITAHAASYAANDGPAGCFRYGFGEGIGCWGEHGDFVRANLPDGFGAIAAIKTTARRLWMHLSDAGNVEVLALFVPAGAALGWARPSVRALALAVTLQIAAYVPFYFDGNYPGGGARFYADVLPIEHVLVALAAATIATRRGPAGALARGSPAFVVGLALLGFAVRAGHDHAQLRDRDGGAPLYSPDAARESDATRGVLFVESDAAYDLAFDPGVTAATGLAVVRRKGDALDALAWRARGSPPSFLARFEPSEKGPGRTVVEPYSVPDIPFLEGESAWPPVEQRGPAYVLPVHTGGSCASGDRALRLLRGEGDGGVVRVRVPASLVAGRSIEIVMLTARGARAGDDDVSARLALVVDGVDLRAATVRVAPSVTPACATALRETVPPGARDVEVHLTPRWTATGDPEAQPLVALDRMNLGATP